MINHAPTNQPFAAAAYEQPTNKARNAKRAAARKERDSLMRSFGLTKVKGSVSGKTYWE